MEVWATIRLPLDISVIQQYRESTHDDRTQRFFGTHKGLRAPAGTMAMGNLSRGQKERDSMLKDFLQERCRSESCGERSALIIAE